MNEWASADGCMCWYGHTRKFPNLLCFVVRVAIRGGQHMSELLVHYERIMVINCLHYGII